MSLKIMNLEFWMSRSLYDEDDLIRCEPVFNRNGQYFDTVLKKCWFEVDGDAFLIPDADAFKFSLQILNHRPLRRVERYAINVLIANRLASKSLIEMMTIDNLSIELRQNKFNAQKFKRRVLNRMKARRVQK